MQVEVQLTDDFCRSKSLVNTYVIPLLTKVQGADSILQGILLFLILIVALMPIDCKTRILFFMLLIC